MFFLSFISPVPSHKTGARPDQDKTRILRFFAKLSPDGHFISERVLSFIFCVANLIFTRKRSRLCCVWEGQESLSTTPQGRIKNMLWLLNIVTYLVNAVVVALSTFGVLGRTNDAVSDDNPTLITPDKWEFYDSDWFPNFVDWLPLLAFALPWEIDIISIH